MYLKQRNNLQPSCVEWCCIINTFCCQGGWFNCCLLCKRKEGSQYSPLFSLRLSEQWENTLLSTFSSKRKICCILVLRFAWNGKTSATKVILLLPPNNCFSEITFVQFQSSVFSTQSGLIRNMQSLPTESPNTISALSADVQWGISSVSHIRGMSTHWTALVCSDVLLYMWLQGKSIPIRKFKDHL